MCPLFVGQLKLGPIYVGLLEVGSLLVVQLEVIPLLVVQLRVWPTLVDAQNKVDFTWILASIEVILTLIDAKI